MARLALLGTVMVEALTFYVVNAWLAAGFDPGQHALSPFAYIVLALLAWGLLPALGQFDISDRASAIAAGVVSVLAIGLALRIGFAGDVALWDFGWLAGLMIDTGDTLRGGADAFFAVFLVTGLWLRTLYRSDAEVDLESIPRSVVPPFAITTGVLIFASYTDAGAEVGAAAAWVYGLAIVSMALSQLALSGATIGTVRAGGVVAVLLGGTAVLAIAGIVFTTLAWGPISGPASAALTWFASKVLVAIFTPPLWLLEQLMRLILPDELPMPEAREMTDTMLGENPEGDGAGDEDTAAEQVGGFILRFIAIAGTLGIVLGLIAWFASRRRRHQSETTEGPQSSGAGGIGDDLRGLLGWRPGRQRRERATADDPAAKLYLEVLHEAEEAGHPRAPATTPVEFQPELEETFHTPVTDEITRLFLEARYAGRPVDPEVLGELERRWRAQREE